MSDDSQVISLSNGVRDIPINTALRQLEQMCRQFVDKIKDLESRIYKLEHP